MNKTLAVDGPAGSGKSSIARLLAKRIDYLYLDTGAIYRALTLYFLENSITHATRDKQKLETALTTVELNMEVDSCRLNGQDVTEAIRTDAVEKAVANYAQLPEVREYVRTFQRRMANRKDIVIDGRDIGTAVFPNAFCKFYLDARLDIRAQRRYEDLKNRVIASNKTMEELMGEIARRDKMDRERVHSPLRIPNDALIIDSSQLSIEDVLERMVHHYNNNLQLVTNNFSLVGSEQGEKFLMAMQEEQQVPPTSSTSEFLDAKIISVGEEIYLDVGRKVDAYISQEEVKRMGEVTLKVGDVIQVVEKARTRGGILVSKYEADLWQGLLKLRESFKAKELVMGVVKDINKGGYVVDIAGTDAFCPLSEYDVMKSHKKQEEIGVESKFEILSLDLRNVIVSRKRPLERVYDATRAEFFKTVKEQDRFQAKVVHVMGYRIIVQLQPGVNAIIRQKEFSWTRSGRVAEQFNRDDEFDVVVVVVDREKQRLEVSRRLAEQDPFFKFAGKYSIGDTISGKVVSTERYGVFVEVEYGVDGMIHVSDLSWYKKVGHPKEVVKIDDVIDAKILVINKDERRLSLGLKQTQTNPWETMEQFYSVGTTLEFKLKAVIKNGLYGLVEDKLECFVHISDTPYKEDRSADLTTVYEPGETQQGKLLRVNKAKSRLELSLEQKYNNPWDELNEIFQRKDVVSGEVVELLDNGVNVKVLSGIIGFCHLSQLAEEKIEKPDAVVKVGEQHSFLIQFMDSEKQKLALSRKDFLSLEKYRDINHYVKSDAGGTKVTLNTFIEKDADTNTDTPAP